MGGRTMWLVCALCLLLLPVSLNAQERANSLSDGAWALQFSFDSGFSGGRVAAKYHLSDKNALRAGLSFFGSTSDLEGSSSFGETFDQDDDFAITNGELLFVRYPRPLAAAHFYFGGGPYVQYREQNRHQFDTDPVNGPVERIREEESIEAGLTGILGAEWFASRALSLHVEYMIRGGKFRRDYKESTTSTFDYDTYETTNEGWEFEAGDRVMMGLAIYF